MVQIVAGFFMVVGAFFIFVAGLGALRMPDLFLRASATTKAATLGVGSILLATAIYFGELGVTSRALATIAFVLLTAPISAHMIGRAAYLSGVALWEGTILDELEGQYNRQTDQLSSDTSRTDTPHEP
jgi:multicomponent Na+:H+ antiporter subunit G